MRTFIIVNVFSNYLRYFLKILLKMNPINIKFFHVKISLPIPSSAKPPCLWTVMRIVLII